MTKSSCLWLVPVFLWLAGGAEADLASHADYSASALKSVEFMEAHHISGQKLDDSQSDRILSGLFMRLDPDRVYFTKEDVREFDDLRLTIDDKIRATDLTFVDQLIARVRVRSRERATEASRLLSRPIEFKSNEVLSHKLEFVADVEMPIRLLKLIKARILKLQDTQIPEPDLAAAAKGVLGQFESSAAYFEWLENDSNSEVLFEFFMIEVTRSWDPHSTYFLPNSYKRLNARMAQKRVSVGIRVREDGFGRFWIDGVVEGGPAWGVVQAGDEIIGFSTGQSEIIPVAGAPFDFLAQLLEGEVGTLVNLSLRSGGKEVRQVTLVRAVVTGGDEGISTRVVGTEVRGLSLQIGVIRIPFFYDDRKGKNCATDTKAILQSDAFRDVDAVMVDLRGNPGGSLLAAVELAGLFIDSGNIVQIRRRGENHIENDPSPGAVYTGPLVVVTNRLSASASELFAGSMMDYGRALIVGDDKTWGKGTVQSIVPMVHVLGSAKDSFGKSGGLKVTMAQFFRMDGTSHHGIGLRPDVVLNSWAMGQGPEGIKGAGAGATTPDRMAPVLVAAENLDPKKIQRVQNRSRDRVRRSRSLTRVTELLAEVERIRSAQEVGLWVEAREKDRWLLAEYHTLSKSSVGVSGFDERLDYDAELVNITVDWIR